MEVEGGAILALLLIVGSLVLGALVVEAITVHAADAPLGRVRAAPSRFSGGSFGFGHHLVLASSIFKQLPLNTVSHRAA
eukprot:7384786-Prymnesium_polylepis.1